MALAVQRVAQVPASLGTAVLRRGDTLETALQRVERGLYRAKELGGSRVCASDEMEDRQEGTEGIKRA